MRRTLAMQHLGRGTSRINRARQPGNPFPLTQASGAVPGTSRINRALLDCWQKMSELNTQSITNKLAVHRHVGHWPEPLRQCILHLPGRSRQKAKEMQKRKTKNTYECIRACMYSR